MKKLLCGTTALVAAGVLSSGAYAADPIKLAVGGYFTGVAGYSSQDDGVGQPAVGTRSHLFTHEAEIFFSGTTTLDNGIKVGVNIQLEAQTSGDQIDENYIWFEGAFGKLQFGGEDDAAYQLTRAGPKPSNFFFGVASPVFSLMECGGNALSLGGACFIGAYSPQQTGDAEKLTYYTPRFGGFQFGISYTPDATEVPNGTTAPSNAGASTYSGLISDSGVGAQGEVISIGANWLGRLGPVSLNVGGGYQAGDLEANNADGAFEDRDSWIFGGTVTWGAIAFGGFYHKDDLGISLANADRTDWGLSATYQMGAWRVGVEYARSKVEAGAGSGLGGVAVAGATGEDEGEAWAFGVNYDMGAGVSLQAELQFWDIDDNLNARANQNSGTVFLIGTTLFF